MAKLPKMGSVSRTPEQEMMWRLNEIETTQDLRNYNGLSSIGTKCVRKLQLMHYDTFRVTHSSRVLRLFNEGHRMEPVLRAELADKLGIISFDDQAEVIGVGGHWKGHIDGKGVFQKDSPFYDGDDVFLAEFKTHNQKSFDDLKKKKVRESKPLHFDQMTSYMGYNKLPRCLYVAYNKNTSEIYVEWVLFDFEHFRELQRKEGEVIMAEELLPRIGNDQITWFECKMCDAKKVCFGKAEIKKSCKNCEHVAVLDEGKWECTKTTLHLNHFDPCVQYEEGKMFWELN